MPPIPPPPGIAGAELSFGTSATIASVVTSRPATEAASCSARRTTLAGSTMPFYDQVDILIVRGIEAESLGLRIQDLADHDRALDGRRFSAIWRIGASMALSTMLMPA